MGNSILQLAAILWGESYFSGVRAFKGAQSASLKLRYFFASVIRSTCQNRLNNIGHLSSVSEA